MGLRNSGVSSVARESASIVRVHMGVWPRLIAPLAAGLVILAVALGLYSGSLGPAVYARFAPSQPSVLGLWGAAFVALSPLLFLAAAMSMVWWGMSSVAAEASDAGAKISMTRAARVAAVGFPKAVVVALAWSLTVLVLVALAPLFVVVGLVGLALAPVSRFSGLARWPSTRALVTLAIPFGAAAFVATRWSLALPAVWLDRVGVTESLRRSGERVRGRTGRVAIIAALALLATIGLTDGIAALGRLVDGTGVGDFVARLVALAIVGPLVIVALTYLYRENQGGGTRASLARVAPVPGARRARVAVGLVATLIVQVILMGPGASPAAASGLTPVQVGIFDSYPPNPIDAGTPVTFSVTVRDPLTAEGVPPSGDVTVAVDGTPLAGPLTLANAGGVGVVQITHTFAPGSHTVEASYPGDATFAAGYLSVNLDAFTSTTAALATSTSALIYGGDLTLTGTVTTGGATATGTVEFLATPSGGAEVSLGSATLNGSGVAALTTSTAPSGTLGVVAHYLGDGAASEATSSPATVTVTPASTSVGIVLAPSSPSPAGVGITASVTVSATDSPATPAGTVSLYEDLGGGWTLLNTGTLSGGAVDIAASLPPGNHSIVAAFDGTSDFNQSHWSESQTIDPWPAGMTLSQTGATTVFGEDFDVTATITTGGPDVATGDVEFFVTPDGGTATSLGFAALDGAGKATLTVGGLAADGYVLTAEYAGDGVADAASASGITHTVAKAAALVDIALSNDNPTYGTTVTATLTATADAPGAGVPSGAVELYLDGLLVDTLTLNVLGQTLTASPVPVGAVGAHTWTATYLGDANFASGEDGTADMTVAKKGTAVSAFLNQPSTTYGTDQTWSGAVSTGMAEKATGTVEVRTAAGGLVASGTLDSSGAYTIVTDRFPVGSSLSNDAYVAYLGDDTFAPSLSYDAGPLVSLDMVKANLAPTVTLDPTEAALGGTVRVVVDFGNPGAGPVGSATFTNVTDPLNPVVYGSSVITDGVASLEIPVADAVTYVDVDFAGSANFNAASVTNYRIDASRAVAGVAINDPGVLTYGQVFNLSADVTVGAPGLDPDGSVDFRAGAGGNVLIAGGVPVTSGVAAVQVCAGDAAGCPAGMPLLGLGDAQIVAVLGATAQHLGATSSPYAYAPGPAPTTLDLALSAPSGEPGQGIQLTATVTDNTGSNTPEGTVTFYGSKPTTGGGTQLVVLGIAPLNALGWAQIVVGIGSGPQDIQWPADAVRADFYGADAFGSSTDAAAFAVNRLATTLSTYASAATVFGNTPVNATLSHAPGASDDYLGQVTFTSDTGQTCRSYVPAGTSGASCALRWDTVGAHSFTASYDGDVVYAPGTSATGDVTVATTTPVLGASVAPSVVAGVPVDVTWNTIDPAATGTVTVWGDGTQWCVADIQDGICTGTFTNASSTGSPVAVIVRYSGDATWNGVEDDLSTRVSGCVPIDVRSTDVAQGIVTVDTPSNCGAGDYVVGTVVTVTAHPIAPGEFAGWEQYDATSPGLVAGATTLTTSFTLTTDSWTWVRIARFRTPCLAVASALSGHGYLYASPASNCTVPGTTTPGYLYGTALTLTPTGLVNPSFGVSDVFYAFGALPAGVTKGHDRFGRATASLVVTEAVTIPVTFGPRCESVSVAASPTSDGDSTSVLTAPNCHSPLGDGYLPLSSVSVTAVSGDPDLAIERWSLDGVTLVSAGSSPQPTVALGAADAVITAHMVACYAVTLVVDGATQLTRQAGAASLSLPPNCPDGSARYVAGTELTATPEILLDGAVFRGWDGEVAVANGSGVGVDAANAKTFAVTGTTTVTAAFMLPDACSRLTIFDRDSLVSFGVTGCGEGFYNDLQKQWAVATGVPQASLWEQKYRTQLSVTKTGNTNLNVYASVKGDARNCFGGNLTASGPTPDAGQWHSLGALGSGSADCWVGGNVNFRFEACQTLDPDIAITRVGDTSGAVYHKGDLPGVLYVPTAQGNIAPMDPTKFAWVAAQPLSEVDDEYVVEGRAPGACTDAGNAYQPGITLMLGADSPAAGIEFKGWTSDEEEPLIEDNPVVMDTDDSRPVMAVSAAYQINCYHVTFGEGITIEGDAPRCPGFADEDNMFIGGTGILIRAAQHVGNRSFGDFTSGVVKATVVKDPDSEERTAFAFVTGDMTVAAKYPTDGERQEAAWANAGKILVSIAAVAAPIMLGVACPPCGLVLTVVGVAAAMSSLIPGADNVTAFLDIINPVKLLECTTNWGLGNGEETVATVGDPQALAKVDTAVLKGVRKLKPPPTAAQAAAKAAETAAKNLTKSSSRVAAKAVAKMAAKDALQVAGFAYSLYDAGLFSADLGYQTVDQLRDTATFTNCVADAQRLAH